MAPWSSSQPQTEFFTQLHCELTAFSAWVRPSPVERRQRLAAIEKVRQAVRRSGILGGGSDLVVFGSHYTELCLFDSDVDLAVVNFPDFRFYTKEQKLACMKKLAKFLVEERICSGKVKIVDTARVPLVDIAVDGISIDVAFSSFADGRLALKSSDWILSQIEKFPSIRFLVLFLKTYLKLRGLNDVFKGGLGSFLLSVLVSVYVKNHPSLNSSRIYAQTNLGHLLFDFFKFFATELDENRIALLSNGQFEPRKPDALHRGASLSVILSDHGFGAYKDIGQSVWLWPKIKRAFANTHAALSTWAVDASSLGHGANVSPGLTDLLCRPELLGPCSGFVAKRPQAARAPSQSHPQSRPSNRTSREVVDLVAGAPQRPEAVHRVFPVPVFSKPQFFPDKDFIEISDSDEEQNDQLFESRRKRFRHH